MGGFWHGLAMRLYRVGIGLAAACGHAKARGWLAMRKGLIAGALRRPAPTGAAVDVVSLCFRW